VYLAVDYEARVIKLAEIRQNAVTSSPVRFPSADTDCTSNKLSAGTKAAIALGVVVGLGLMIVTWFFYGKKRREMMVTWFFHGQKRRNKENQQIAHKPKEDTPASPRASQPGLEFDVRRSQSTGLTPLSHEISAERRTYELWSPTANGSHPPPSPRAPGAELDERHISVASQHTLPVHSNQQWNA
jgi:hypothetical protein